MSWRYVPGSVPCPGDCKMQGLERFVTSSETNTVSRCSLPVCETAAWSRLPSGTTLPHSTGDPGVDEWISSLPVIPVSPLAKPVLNKGRTTSAISGPISAVSFARFDPVTSCWKTSQACLWQAEESQPQFQTYLATWPNAGMMRNGECYRLRFLAPHISVKESSLLRTPTKADGKQFYALSLMQANKRIQAGRQITWIHQAIIFKQWKSAFANPRFSEAMMGLPIGWSDLKPLAKPLCARSLLPLGRVL